MDWRFPLIIIVYLMRPLYEETCHVFFLSSNIKTIRWNIPNWKEKQCHFWEDNFLFQYSQPNICFSDFLTNVIFLNKTTTACSLNENCYLAWRIQKIFSWFVINYFNFFINICRPKVTFLANNVEPAADFFYPFTGSY